jgi:hypothetical protein
MRPGRNIPHMIRSGAVVMVAWFVAVGSALTGCGSSSPAVDPAAKPFIAKAEKLYATLPLFPGSRLKFTQQSAFYAAECDGAPVAGGGTIYDYSFPPDSTMQQVARFYLPRLRTRGWHLTSHERASPAHDAGPIYGFAKGDASLSVNIDNGYHHGFEVGIGVSDPTVKFQC